MEIDLARINKYLDWCKQKLYLDYKAKTAQRRNIRNVYRGQVYNCYFGIGVGSEQEKNNRPCVILQKHAANMSSPNTIVAPITKSSSTLDVVVPIATQYNPDGSILLEGHVLLGNIVTISKARLTNLVTKLPPNEMKNVDLALSYSVELYPYYKDLEDKFNKKIEYIAKLKAERNLAQDNLKEILELLGETDISVAKLKIQEFLK